MSLKPITTNLITINIEGEVEVEPISETLDLDPSLAKTVIGAIILITISILDQIKT